MVADPAGSKCTVSSGDQELIDILARIYLTPIVTALAIVRSNTLIFRRPLEPRKR